MAREQMQGSFLEDRVPRVFGGSAAALDRRACRHAPAAFPVAASPAGQH
jgi:hypothetical protein